MKVVLMQDVKGVGKKYQLIEVSEGYGRNFLIPKKLAKLADNKSVNEAKTKEEAIKFKKKTEKEAAIDTKNELEKRYIEFRHKIGENGKLFGSVTEKEIADEIKAKFNIDVDKKKITLKTPIKQIGSYVSEIKLYEGVVANLKIVVVGM